MYNSTPLQVFYFCNKKYIFKLREESSFQFNFKMDGNLAMTKFVLNAKPNQPNKWYNRDNYNNDPLPSK